MLVPQSSVFVVRWRAIWLSAAASLFLASFLLVSCSGLSFGGGGGGGGSSSTATATPSQLPLVKLHWCSKPFILFRDEHAPVTSTPVATSTATASSTPATRATVTSTASTTVTPTTTSGGAPTTVTEWSQVKPNLGFTVFLPAMLPRGSCLVSASGTLHDPIFGGNFIIGYLLPNSNPISLSEAPVRSNSPQFQCSSAKGDTGSSSEASMGAPGSSTTAAASPTQTPVLLCTGVRDNTNIVFSARGTETSLKQFFDTLQPDVEWVPAS